MPLKSRCLKTKLLNKPNNSWTKMKSGRKANKARRKSLEPF